MDPAAAEESEANAAEFIVSPEFWQLLLTAELPFSRRENLIRRAFRAPTDTHWQRFFDDAPELSPADRERVRKADPSAVHAALQSGAELLAGDQRPIKLAGLDGAAPALFIWGDKGCLDRPSIGIVGTRGASTYGKAAARKFAEAFAQAGVTVVSGGAQGIDAAAHEGALEAGGETAAVMACGIDRAYPAAHRHLFERIRTSGGCLVSQFPAGWNPRSDSFVLRNATIAALSDALLVVEAPERSGALITANRANEYGRPVYVVPGNISVLSFRGSHALIREGATLVDHPDQVLEDLGIAPGLRLKSEAKVAGPAAQILLALGAEPMSAEKIVEITALDPSAVLSELTMLELDAKVLRGPGGYILAP